MRLEVLYWICRRSGEGDIEHTRKMPKPKLKLGAAKLRKLIHRGTDSALLDSRQKPENSYRPSSTSSPTSDNSPVSLTEDEHLITLSSYNSNLWRESFSCFV